MVLYGCPVERKSPTTRSRSNCGCGLVSEHTCNRKTSCLANIVTVSVCVCSLSVIYGGFFIGRYGGVGV